jgi:hypothetical protein
MAAVAVTMSQVTAIQGMAVRSNVLKTFCCGESALGRVGLCIIVYIAVEK